MKGKIASPYRTRYLLLYQFFCNNFHLLLCRLPLKIDLHNMLIIANQISILSFVAKVQLVGLFCIPGGRNNTLQIIVFFINM